MSLALSMTVGDTISIGEKWIRLVRIVNSRLVELETSNGDRVMIDAVDETKVFEDVWIGLGKRPASVNARISIDAPREMTIVRRDHKKQ